MMTWILKLFEIAAIFTIVLYWVKAEKGEYLDIRSIILNRKIWIDWLNIIKNPINFILFIAILMIISSYILILRILLVLLLMSLLVKYIICYYNKKSFTSFYTNKDIKFYPSIKNIVWNLWLQLYFSAHNIFYTACFISSKKRKPKIDIPLMVCSILLRMFLGFPFMCIIISFDITETIVSVLNKKYKLRYLKFAILEELNNLILGKFPYYTDFSTAPARKIHFENGQTFNPKGILVDPKECTVLGNFFYKQKNHLYMYPKIKGGEFIGISATSHPKEWMDTIPMYGNPQSGRSVAVINQHYSTEVINNDINFTRNIAYSTGVYNDEVRSFLIDNAMYRRFLNEMDIQKIEFDNTVKREFGRYFGIAIDDKELNFEARKVAEMIEKKYYNMSKRDINDLVETHKLLMNQCDKILGTPFDYNEFIQLRKNLYSDKNFEDFFKILNNALHEIFSS